MRFSLESRDLAPGINILLDSSGVATAVNERTVEVDHPFFRSRSFMLTGGEFVVIHGENRAICDLELCSEQVPPPIVLALTLDDGMPHTGSKSANMPHTLPRSHGIFHVPEIRNRFRLDAGRVRRIFEINLTHSYLTTLFERFPALGESPLSPLERGAALSLHSPAGGLTASMTEVAHAILDSRIHGNVQALFVEAKVLELISLQLADLDGGVERAPRRRALSRSRIDRMEQAREELLSHLVAPPTLRELARLVGTNEFQLKRDFKILFGKSVFDYLFEVRMAMAVERLRDTEASIEEIAGEVGYSSAAHFSTAFRRRFGCPPSRLRPPRR